MLHSFMLCTCVDQGVILDRSVYSDCVFAQVCTNEGFISSEGEGMAEETVGPRVGN